MTFLIENNNNSRYAEMHYERFIHNDKFIHKNVVRMLDYTHAINIYLF